MSIKHETFVIQLRGAVNELLDSNDYNIDNLCQRLSVSRSHLHRQVKLATGVSTSLYVREIRLDRGTLMLSRSNDSIAQIAHKAGFNSAQNFSKYFTLREGISPRQYRSARLEDSDNNELGRPGEAVGQSDISLAVLPFVNASSDKEQDYYVDGLTEEIQYRLSQLEAFKVAGRASTFYFKGTILPLEKVADQLDVDHLVVGSVRKYDGILRIAVELIEAATRKVLWNEIFDSTRDEIFKIQDAIVNKIQYQLRPLSDTATLNYDNNHKTNSVAAYEYYLKGRSEFALRADLSQALFFYQKAVVIDPLFAHAYYGLAFTRIYGCIFSGYRPKDMLPQIEDAYKKAASINSKTAEFYILKGWMDFYFYNEYEKALNSMRKAIEIDDQSIEVYRIWAYFYCFRGEYTNAIPLAQKAHELDPLGFNPWFSYADILRRARHYDTAFSLLLPLKEKFPNHLLIDEITGLCYVQSAQFDKANEIFKLTDDYPKRFALWTIGTYMFHHQQGATKVLQDLLSHLIALQSKQWIQPTILALLNYHLGNTSLADDYMDEAVDEMDFGLKHINSEPYWDPFRAHPKVVEALERVDFLPLV